MSLIRLLVICCCTKAIAQHTTKAVQRLSEDQQGQIKLIMNFINRSFVLAICILICLTGCTQVSTNCKYDISSYYLYSRGGDKQFPFVFSYRNVKDSNCSYKEIYFDSAYTKLISKSFFYNNVANGPYVSYSNGKLFIEANFKNGKIDGKRITYEDGRVSREAYFKDGIKIGLWIEYNKFGKIIRRTKYDNSGNLVSDLRY